MKAILAFLVFCFIACSQKLNLGDLNSIHGSQSVAGNQYLSCSSFADKTFHGYIWTADPDSQKGCIHIDISQYPKELLENADLFLQAYPFSVRNQEMVYGSSLQIHTVPKFLRDGQRESSPRSYIIDSYFVEIDLGMELDHFFLDHLLKICDIEEKWKGLQLVIYYEKAGQDPVPIRTSKFLLPPFLIHPEHFREENGEALGAFHPFLEYTSEMKSQSSSSYYDLAEEMCSHIL